MVSGTSVHMFINIQLLWLVAFTTEFCSKHQKWKSYATLLNNLSTLSNLWHLLWNCVANQKWKFISKFLHMQLSSVISPCFLLLKIAFDLNPLQKKRMLKLLQRNSHENVYFLTLTRLIPFFGGTPPCERPCFAR